MLRSETEEAHGPGDAPRAMKRRRQVPKTTAKLTKVYVRAVVDGRVRIASARRPSSLSRAARGQTYTRSTPSCIVTVTTAVLCRRARITSGVTQIKADVGFRGRLRVYAAARIKHGDELAFGKLCRGIIFNASRDSCDQAPPPSTGAATGNMRASPRVHLFDGGLSAVRLRPHLSATPSEDFRRRMGTPMTTRPRKDAHVNPTRAPGRRRRASQLRAPGSLICLRIRAMWRAAAVRRPIQRFETTPQLACFPETR